METATIHVLDDDEAVRQSLVILIDASSDYEVIAHATVEDFQRTYDSSRPGCLLLDYRMPGMTGIELQQWLLGNNISLPVILLTGHASVEMAVQAMSLGAVDVLEKPCQPEELIARINEAVASDQARRRQDPSP